VNVANSVTVKLKLGRRSQVEVSAQAETINTTDASLGNAFDEIRSSSCLGERNVPDLLSLQAGVAYTGN